MSHIEKTIDSTQLLKERSSACAGIRWNWKTENKPSGRLLIIRAGSVFWQWTRKGKYFSCGQFRYPFGRMLLELPAGKLEPGKIRRQRTP